MKLYWLPLLGALCVPAWAQQAEPYIIGGEAAPAGAWPWMVQVDIRFQATNELGLCGGSLLTPEWVVTAAHCVIGEDDQGVSPADVVIRQGSVFLDGGQAYDVDRIYVPAGFERAVAPEFDNDIALLRIVNGPQPGVRPSLMNAAVFQDLQSRDAAGRDEALTALGWGVTRPGGTTPATRLQQVSLDYVRTGTCRNAWGGNFNSATMVCADELNPVAGQQDTCAGDSGGPLFLGDERAPWLVGLTSYGQSGCADDLPSVYTNLASQVGFVESASAGAGDPLVDLAVEVGAERFYAAPGEDLTVPMTLANRSLGNAVSNATLNADGEAGTTVSVNGNPCGTLLEDCYSEPSLAASASRSLTLEARPLTNAETRASVTLEATSDQEEYRVNNNAPVLTLVFSNRPDLDISARLLSARRDGEGQGRARVEVTVANLSTVPGANADAVFLRPTLPAGTTLSGSSVPCDTRCDLGALGTGESLALTLDLTAGNTQNAELTLSVDDNGDFPEDNNEASVALVYTAAAAESGGDGGGGGGSLGAAGLLIALAAARRYRG